jgi:aminopeptidase 2
VWSGIAESLSSLVSIWWENPRLVDHLNAFRRVCHLYFTHLYLAIDLSFFQALFVPLVNRLGYHYADTDSSDTLLLRTCAITQAAQAKDPG